MAPADTAAADGGGITKLLGQTLLSGTSQTSTADLSGSGKYLGLYFSAHWCPPCKAFTPMLAKFYSEFKTSHAHKDDFDIVFVSSDKAKDQFEQYYSEMPWKALPYDQRDTKAKLSSRFKVRASSSRGPASAAAPSSGAAWIVRTGPSVPSERCSARGYTKPAATPSEVLQSIGGSCECRLSGAVVQVASICVQVHDAAWAGIHQSVLTGG